MTLRWLPATSGKGLVEDRAFFDLRHFEQPPAFLRFPVRCGSGGANLVHKELSCPVFDTVVVRLGYACTPVILELDEPLPGDCETQLFVS